MKNSDGKWVNWLVDAAMLPRELPNARIMRFGYRSEWSGPKEVETKKTQVHDVAEMLLDGLKYCRDASKLEFIGYDVTTNEFSQGSNSTTTFRCS